MNLISKKTDKIECIPATIRKCRGIIIETLTVEPERSIIKESLEEFKNAGYHIYGLRHKENDMSEPHYVYKNGVLVNRFGWFISKDKMKFKNDIRNPGVRITVSNSNYYGVVNSKKADIDYEEKSFDYGVRIKLSDFMDNANSIIQTMTNISNTKKVFKKVKEEYKKTKEGK